MSNAPTQKVDPNEEWELVEQGIDSATNFVRTSRIWFEFNQRTYRAVVDRVRELFLEKFASHGKTAALLALDSILSRLNNKPESLTCFDHYSEQVVKNLREELSKICPEAEPTRHCLKIIDEAFGKG